MGIMHKLKEAVPEIGIQWNEKTCYKMYGEDGILLNNVTSCTGHACALYFHYKVVDALEEEVEQF